MTSIDKDQRRPYQKPQLKIIELTPEELMGKCRLPNSAGPGKLCINCSQALSS
ncbi:MAG: hypothetical protein ACE15E_15625 [Acidobacteriota bacterium]